MSLLFVEGFDYYNDYNDIGGGGKWGGRKGTTQLTFETGRDGVGKALKISSSNIYYCTHKLKTPGDVFYIGFGLKLTTLTSSSDFLVISEGGTTHFVLKYNADGTLTAKRNTATLGSTGAVLSSDTWVYLEVYVKIANTGGEVTVKIDGNTELTLTSQDTQNGSTGVCNTLKLAGASGNLHYDDMYICDDAGSVNNGFLGDCTVETLVPNGAGSSTGLTASAGSNYAAVDEKPVNTSDYVYSSTVTNKDLYAVENLADNTVTVHGVQVAFHAKKEDSGERGLKPICKTGTTEGAGDEKMLGYSDYHSSAWIFETDPDTAVAWLGSGVDGMEMGVEVST